MKITIILIALLFFLPVSTVAAEIFPRGKCGRYEIKNACQLAEIQAQATLFDETGGMRGSLDFLSGDYVLAADIDLPISWTPIGDSDTNARFAFCGTFDGAGFVIRGLNISDSSARSVTRGLFGKVEGAEIRNVVLENPVLHAYGDYGSKEFSTGLLAGEIIGGKIENIRIVGGEIIVTAPEAGNGAVGGLVGKASDTQFENITITDTHVGDVNGTVLMLREPRRDMRNIPLISSALRAVGGVAGYLENCTAKNILFLNGKIDANAISSGGIAGQIRGGEFFSCGANFVTVDGTEYVGGFVGLVQENARFENCHATARVLGNGTIGGFAGRVNGAEAGAARIGAEFIRCRAFGSAGDSGDRGAVLLSPLAGGFVGRLAGRSRVTSSNAYVYVISCNSGGFVGEITNASRIEFSAAHGAVFGSEAAGGFAAIISSTGAPNTITSSLALGRIVAGSENTTFRFAAIPEHDGINGCYSFLGMAVIANGVLSHVIPNPYGKDGGDISIKSLRGMIF
ncbi:MAG: hypothetical protein FWE27_08705 [Defluviitaleaceae bacterium]|nr:hypothetical protein [Defluviitaleaceae bacterium]